MTSARTYLNSLLKHTNYKIEKKGPEQSVYPLISAHRDYLSRQVALACSYTVQAGPFKGLRLHQNASWNAGDVAAKLIGAYELELHPLLHQCATQNHDCVVNIGCADGFYAVGMQRTMPEARVFAFDIDPNAAFDISRTQELNNTFVAFEHFFDFSNPPAEVQSYEDILFIIDCEGCEGSIINMPPELAGRSTFLVEMHDLFVPGITETVRSFFNKTHDVIEIKEQGRDPNVFKQLDHLGSLDKYLLLCEFRGASQNWLYASPKQKG